MCRRENLGQFQSAVLILVFVLSLIAVGRVGVLAVPQAPMVKEGGIIQVGEGVYVIPDQRVNLVPNIGTIVGQDGVLVVDTGMGPRNAETVIKEVRRITEKKILYLTITHFHPEHGMGAQAFRPETTIIYPMAQKEELFDKANDFIKLFSGFSPEIAELLQDVEIVSPQITFRHKVEIDLGGLPVRLLHFGAAHTRGDNLVFLPQQKILFAGDVVLNRFFPIMPDADANGSHWIKILEKLEALEPTIVVPGHGEVGDASLIAAMKQYLVSLRESVRELHGRGKSAEEIESVLTDEFQKKYSHWDNPNWLKNAIQNFLAELKR